MTATDPLVLRTVYIDPDVDKLLYAEAKASNGSKAALLRRYLTAGRRRAKRRPEVLHAADDTAQMAPLVLQTVHLDADLDHRLVVEAFDAGVSKNDLLRRYLRIGLDLAAV